MTMFASIQDLVQTTPGWIASDGTAGEVILSSRARLARNLTALPFVHRTKKSDLVRIINKVETAVRASATLPHALFFSMPEMSALDRQFLVERRLISPALAEERKECGVFVSPAETAGVMVNEEDHLRIQTIQAGLHLEAVWRAVDRIDTELSHSLDFAFSNDFGYLTACPTNVGTGLRVSVLIHLPGLVLTKNIEPLVRGITQVGLTVRGLYGEGTEALGNLFQISNQRTLGRSEEEIVTTMDRIVRQLIQHERRACEAVLHEAPSQVEDRVWRAYGVLQYARVLTAHDAVNALSSVRLGVSLGIIATIDIPTLNRLVVVTQSAHVQKLTGRALEGDAQEIARADVVRGLLTPSRTPPVRRANDRSNP
ncbi:MAG: protein arginine kinase [Candidatus Latescibacteria bacterium]|nr:protein arginine kinase [Candidatus Latescibacterota bacterium]